MAEIVLKDYASLINLNRDYSPPLSGQVDREEVVNQLIDFLMKERKEFIEVPNDYKEKRNVLRALLNIREAKPLIPSFLEKLDDLLQVELAERGIVDTNDLPTLNTVFPNNSFSQSDKIILWHGDIVRLNTDAIVNAANKKLLGCFQPLHRCIDNAIHSAAGPQLRNDCEIIISLQGEPEETGQAKITRGYNLPSKYILHTVGPIVSSGSNPTILQKNQLESCYISCLELAAQMGNIKSIAFCAISTGVFGYPKTEAAEIAVQTVNKWIINNPDTFEKVIFNVFSMDDYHIYSKLFQ